LSFQWVTLTDRSEIKELFQKGKRINNKILSICFKKNNLSYSRYLFCSDRKSKTAVNRNRIKRILRAILREKEMLRPEGFDLALLGGMGLLNANFNERKKVLSGLLRDVTIK